MSERVVDYAQLAEPGRHYDVHRLAANRRRSSTAVKYSNRSDRQRLSVVEPDRYRARMYR